MPAEHLRSQRFQEYCERHRIDMPVNADLNTAVYLRSGDMVFVNGLMKSYIRELEKPARVRAQMNRDLAAAEMQGGFL